MQVKEAIKARRSIRAYEDKEIPEDIITQLIDAGRLAPSGSNRQGARYKVIKDRQTIQKLKDEKIYPQDFVYTAPVLIICCCDKTAYPEQEDSPDDKIYGTNKEVRCIRDLSIASSFIVLQAQELGLGTCYIGWMDKEKSKKILNLPENIDILFTITVGYPAEQPSERKKKEMDEILL